MRYDWPGNVRELKNVIERAMLLDAKDALLVAHLPTEITRRCTHRHAGHGTACNGRKRHEPVFPMTLRDVERIQIERTLEQTHGNKSRPRHPRYLAADVAREAEDIPRRG